MNTKNCLLFAICFTDCGVAAPVEQSTTPIVVDNRDTEGTVVTEVIQVGAGTVCQSTVDCGEDALCVPDVCGQPGHCVEHCTPDAVSYCGCDGQTFTASATCPEAAFAHRGSCEAVTNIACTGQGECPSGTVCAGPEGCGMAWSCVPSPACTRDLVTFCGCDGTEFQSSGSCPDRPYATRGPCPVTPVSTSTGAQQCSSSTDCPQGQMCEGTAGCNTPWVCVPARPCTRDLVRYCGCDGQTFRSSGSCPGRPHTARGACPANPN